jgi:hypothetical protein
MRTTTACTPLLLALLLALLWAAAAAAAEPPVPSPYLAELSGDWELTGTVQGKPAHYRAHGACVLNRSWLEFSMRDVATPPAYEARVYIGYDRGADDYIAHWLDKFGAAGARVLGSGHLSGRTLVLNFPYAEGAFRDTLTLADAGRGTLLIEAQDKDGRWSTFALYQMKRLSTPAPARPAGAAASH